MLEETPEGPLDNKEIKPVNLREINPEYSLEVLMLKLKLQYFGHLMRTGNSLEMSLMLGKTKGRKRKGHQMIRWPDSVTDAVNINLGKLQEKVRTGRPGVLQSMASQRVGHDWVTEQQQQNLKGNEQD